MIRFNNPGAVIEDNLRSEALRSLLNKTGNLEVLLDLGCGPKPYAHIYNPHFQRCIGADLADGPFPKKEVDIHCEATAVPLPDGSVDFILCTEVLHDIREPELFFREVFRLLKPGGQLFLTSPFLVPIVDGTYDHYRYTTHGLRHHLLKGGFSVNSITPVGDIFAVQVSLMIKPVLKFFNRLSKTTGLGFIYTPMNPLLFLTAILPQLVYLAMLKTPLINKFLNRFDYGPIGYISVAIKPQP